MILASYNNSVNSLDILHYVVSASVIVIALTIIFIGIMIGVILYEIRKVLISIQQTTKEIQELKTSIQNDFIGNFVSFWKKIFSKKL